MRLGNALNTLLLFFVVGASAAFGQTKYWDIDASSQAGAGGTAPSGTWNAANSNWNTNSSGMGFPTTWTAGNVAVFAAGSNATRANDSGLGTPIGAAHYDLWRNNFSHSTLHGSGSGLDSAAVPEPGAFALACGGEAKPQARGGGWIAGLAL